MVLYPPNTNLLSSSPGWHSYLVVREPEIQWTSTSDALRYDIVQALRQLACFVANRFYLLLRDLLTLANLFEGRLRLFVKHARHIGGKASCCFAGTFVFFQYTGHQAMLIGFFCKVHHI